MAATLQQAADRWEANASGASAKWAENIQSTQADQAGRAIAAKASMVSNFNQSVTSGRWERRIAESGGTANWKAQSVAKAANYSTGVGAGKQKYATAMQKWLPITQGIAQQVRNMPSGNIGASVARATAFIQAMHAAKQSA